jgi:hypothetical protein
MPSKDGCRFRKTEVARAMRAAEQAGKKVTQFKIDQTGITLVLDNNEATDTAPANEWDEAAE